MRSNYVGRRYRGRVACFAFVRDWLADHGLTLPDYDYPRDAHLEALREHIAAHAERVDAPAVGDVVLLRSDNDPVHLGIVIEPGRIAHHTETHGVIIERIDGIRMRGRVVAYLRPRLPEPVR